MNYRLVASFLVSYSFCSGYLSFFFFLHFLIYMYSPSQSPLPLPWVPVLYEDFCFVLPTCDFLFSCWGGILRSTFSCEGHIRGPILCKFSFIFQNTVISRCPNPLVVFFIFNTGLFLLCCGQGTAPNIQQISETV